MNKHIHLIVPDLFLPHEVAAEACVGLHLPALERILARAQPAPLTATSLEAWLCAAFGVVNESIAPITLLADGGYPGSAYWMRVDPVHLILRGNQFILRPIATLSADEAAQFCASLNQHFSAEGLHFAAQTPQHWYLRLEHAPAIITHPLAQAAGKDVNAYLPQGEEALRWHKLLNEIQMLLFEHPVNQERETRGDWIINSVWPWGGGYAPGKLLQPFERVFADSPLVAAFAKAAEVSQAGLPADSTQYVAEVEGETLIVWDGLRHALQHGDLGAWRDSVQQLERSCANALLQALRRGRIEKITLDVLQAQAARRFVLTRGKAWQFWHLPRRLDGHALV